MKTIGLLGGMSWESTALYYRLINEEVRNRLGDLHSAKIAMVSVDFEPLEHLQHQGQWDQAADILVDQAKKVESAGADFLLICSNTMHKLAGRIESAIEIPVLHIVDATAKMIESAEIETVGLVATSFTMEQDFYKRRFSDAFAIDIIVPQKEERVFIHDVIYKELCKGIVNADSKKKMVDIMLGLEARGAQAIVEGCTEIVMLVQQQHVDIPLFDTTEIHAREAVDMALRI